LPRATGLTKKAPPAVGPVDRTQLRRAYRPDEEQVALERLAEAALKPSALK
jgi:hypothetical protein